MSKVIDETHVRYIRKVRYLSQKKVLTVVNIFSPSSETFLGKL